MDKVKMSEIKIDKRKISVSKVRRILSDGKPKIYPQYRISLPKEFIEEHGSEVYLIADSIGIITKDKDTLMKVLEKFPELRGFAIKMKEEKLFKKEKEKCSRRMS